MRAYTDPESYGLRVKTPEEVRAIVGELRQRLEALYGERLRGLYLYGSYARNDAEPGSDLDVLIVLDRIGSYWAEGERSSYEVAALSLEHDVTISLIQIPEEDWHQRDTPFLRSVRREGRPA